MRELNVNEIQLVSGGKDDKDKKGRGGLVTIIYEAVRELIDFGTSGGGNSSNTISADGASDGVRWGTRP